MSLTSRVLARYLEAKKAPDPEFFLSAKFFREQKADLTKRLKAPLKSGSRGLDSMEYVIGDTLTPFFKKFEQDFAAVITYQKALDFVHQAVEGTIAKLAKIGDYARFVGTIVPLPPKGDVEAELRWLAHNEALGVFEEKVSNLQDFLKYEWDVDKHLREVLVNRTSVGITTPELKKAFEASWDDSYGDVNSLLRWEYLTQMHFYDTAKKTLKRKPPADPITFYTQWVGAVYEALFRFNSDYVDPAKPLYREIDLYGMKVVINDNTVTPEDTGNYIQFIDETYARLRAKKLESAWYGHILIECKECGGINSNGADYGVGGNYTVKEDTVRIFDRPGRYIVDLLAHELGHRYWYQKLTSEQRTHFADLVRVHKRSRPDPKKMTPPYIISPEREKKVKGMILDYGVKIVHVLAEFRDSKEGYTSDMAKFRPQLSSLAEDFKDETNYTLDYAGTERDITPAVSDLFKEVQKDAQKVVETLSYASRLDNYLYTSPDENAENQAFSELKENVYKEVVKFLDDHMNSAYSFIKLAIMAHNAKETREHDPAVKTKEWQAEFDNDPRPVSPFSEYGSNNISEAWAEVFMAYVTNKDLDRDQLESFKTILKRSSLVTAEQVLARFRLLVEDCSCTST